MTEPEIIPASKPLRATMIKGLIPTLPERGKIKIGIKGRMITSQHGAQFQPPQKLDHFLITTLARGGDDNFLRDEEMHERLGDKPTEIPIRLLYDSPELNFPTRYAAYKGRTLWCSGDGEKAQRLKQDASGHFELDCPCHLSDPTYTPKRGEPPRCKMNGALSVIIDGASGLGGVWKLRTTSYNSITGLLSSMAFLRSITGGILANIPLRLRVQPKQAANPSDGSSVLIYIVTLDFDGDMAALQQLGHQIALDRATTKWSIITIEQEARRQLALAAPANAPLPGDDAEDVVSEFYPESYDEPPEDSWTENVRPTRAQFRKQATTTESGPQDTSDTSTTDGARKEQDGDGVQAQSSDPAHPADQTGVVGAVRDEGPDAYNETARVMTERELWDVADPQTGDIVSYEDVGDAEMALTKIFNNALSRALNARKGTLAAKAVEVAAESNDALLKSLPEDVYLRFNDMITRAMEQIKTAHAKQKPAHPAPARSQQGAAVSGSVGGTPAGAATPTSQSPQQPPADRSRPAPNGGATPSPPAGGVSGERREAHDISIKVIKYGPGRGTNWAETVKGAIEIVRVLDMTELEVFRTFGTNGQVFSQLALVEHQSRQQGRSFEHLTQLTRALNERDEFLRSQSSEKD